MLNEVNNRVIAVLLGCLHQDPSRIDPNTIVNLSREDWKQLSALAAVQRVRPLFYRNLRQRGWLAQMPQEEQADLRANCHAITANAMRYRQATEKLCTALRAEGIPVIVLKGIYLAAAVYDHIGLREMNDIDILVPADDLAPAAQVVESQGYTAIQPYSSDVTQSVTHHLPRFLGATAIGIEVHWNITKPGQSFAIDVGELWQHAIPVTLGSVGVQALGHEDLLLHLCQHTSYVHRFEFGLRPFCDIAESITKLAPSLDWQLVCHRAQRWGWERGVYLVLRLAREFVGAHVPSYVLRSLQPAGCDEQIMATARALVMTDKRFTTSVSPHVNRMWKKATLWSRLHVAWGRIFVTRNQLAALHSVPLDSKWLPLYYGARFASITRRFSGQIVRLWRGEEDDTRLSDHQERLHTWLFDAQ